ncbi:MAG TPA: GDP-mannose 4,6-dehydratase [bacterium]|nr:GDP-mannose 4,6-dehydratase [bacterium]
MAKRILVTGGAGFIGSWTVKAFLDDTKHQVFVLDDFSNGLKQNLEEFRNEPRLADVKKLDIAKAKETAAYIDKIKPHMCVHLAAQVIVQDSIFNPVRTFDADVRGAFNLLECCRRAHAGFAFMSTCMVYDQAGAASRISERHPVVPKSPYAGAKLAAEHLAMSYHHAYGMPVVIMRPFNTYGPRQKASGEGGVVSIFLSRQLKGENLNIYGTGKQTRDLLYVADCADFVLKASMSKAAEGLVLNAATGRDVSVNTLARLAIDTAPVKTGSKIKLVKHIHPQSEIMKLCGNAAAAKRVLGWKPATTLPRGLALTREWLSGVFERGETVWHS